MCCISLVGNVLVYRIKTNYTAAYCVSVNTGLNCAKSAPVRGRGVFLAWSPDWVPREVLKADNFPSLTPRKLIASQLLKNCSSFVWNTYHPRVLSGQHQSICLTCMTLTAIIILPSGTNVCLPSGVSVKVSSSKFCTHFFSFRCAFYSHSI